MKKETIYWRDQCRYCLNAQVCMIKEQTIDYMNRLDAVDTSVVSGILNFTCSNFILDKDKYIKENYFEKP